MHDSPAANNPGAPSPLTSAPALVRCIGLGSALLLGLLAVVVMLGWALEHRTLASVVAGYPTMKFNAALCFSLLGIGLAANLRARHHLRLSCVTLLGTISGLTFAQHWLGADFGIDQLFSTDHWSHFRPARMPMASAFTFAMATLTLALINTSQRLGVLLFDLVLLLGGLAPVVGFATYAFGPNALYGAQLISTLPLPSVIGFLLFFATAVLMAPQRSLLSILSSHSRGGSVVRAMLLPLVFTPLLIGIYIQHAVLDGLFNAAFGSALFATVFLTGGVGALVLFAHQLNRWEYRLHAEQTARADLQGKLAWVLEGSADAILLFSGEGKVLLANHGAAELFGYHRKHLLRLTLEDLIPLRFRTRHRELVQGFVHDGDVMGSRINSDPLRMVAQRADGTELPVEITVVTRRNRNQVFFAATIRDASEQEAQLAELRDAAQIDPLTQVGNRRALQIFIAELTQHDRRHDDSVAVLALDLDHFKHINDDYGHDIGDRVLQAFCRNCERCMRDSDRLFRIGGEEFVVLSPGNTLEGTRQLALRIREMIAATPIDIDAGRLLHVSCSIGANLEATQPFDFPSALAVADMRLYQAKRLGRNRVVAGDLPTT